MRHKYGAKPTRVDGIRFASLKESRRYAELKLLEKAGEIHDLRLQPEFPLSAWHRDRSLYTVVGSYFADFSYCTCLRTPCARMHLVYEDSKSPPTRTALYKWKVKHVRLQYGIEIVEV